MSIQEITTKTTKRETKKSKLQLKENRLEISFQLKF